jgi:FtsH-binding integral membrane protein
MGPSMLVVALLAGIILVPLLSEYGDLRRSFGLSRVAAFATTSLVVPAFAVGLTLALPLQSRPALQWVATVAGTLAVYSLAARAIAASASAAGTAPSRSTRG